jgi:hypothetical protein
VRLLRNGLRGNRGQGEASLSNESGPATRLTQSRKREAKGITSAPTPKPVTQPYSVCLVCGKSIDATAQTVLFRLQPKTSRKLHAQQWVMCNLPTPSPSKRIHSGFAGRYKQRGLHRASPSGSRKRFTLSRFSLPWLAYRVRRLHPGLGYLVAAPVASARGNAACIPGTGWRWPPQRTHLVHVPIQVQLQQIAGIVARPPRLRRLRTHESQLRHRQSIDERPRSPGTGGRPESTLPRSRETS